MTETAPQDAVPLTIDRDADLETVLTAWHAATLRLEHTHEALRGEVRRLTDELAAKNRDLARQNRLADLGCMASHIAHEVRNNMVPVSLYLSLLRRRVADDVENVAVLDKIETGMLALDSTVNDLLSFTVERDPRLASVPLRGLVEDVCGSLAPQLSAQEIGVTTEVADQLRVVADSDMLRRAILNLSLNAIDAMPHGGRLIVSACASAEWVDLEIGDSGPGLSDEVRRRAFEPFFTTKSRGTGLGLAIVQRMAETHGGECFAQNAPEGGAAFTIRLPLRKPEAAV